MAFNPETSKQAVQLIFSRKRVQMGHPEVYFNDMQVSSYDEYKHLGLILDKKLTFSSDIKELLGKANKGIFMVKLLPVTYHALHWIKYISYMSDHMLTTVI